jgi:hypothetical protein
MSKNFLLLTSYFSPALAQALRGVVRNPGIGFISKIKRSANLDRLQQA